MDLYKSKAMSYKVALSIALIRHKPANLTLEEFVRLFQLQFRDKFQQNFTQINQLKSRILELKQEIFMLKNKDLISEAQPVDYERSEVSTKRNDINELDVRFKFRSHLEFMSSLIKLKRIGTSFTTKQLLNEISCETILETLLTFLHQINLFYCESNLVVAHVDQESLKEGALAYPMPKDALEHAIAVFVNVFNIE